MTFVGSYPTRVATDWRARLSHCQSELQREPRGSHAWRWRIQIRVLSFFLSRYGDAPTVDWPAPTLTPPISRWPRRLAVARPTKPVRAILERIAAENAALRAEDR